MGLFDVPCNGCQGRNLPNPVKLWRTRNLRWPHFKPALITCSHDPDCAGQPPGLRNPESRATTVTPRTDRTACNAHALCAWARRCLCGIDHALFSGHRSALKTRPAQGHTIPSPRQIGGPRGHTRAVATHWPTTGRRRGAGETPGEGRYRWVIDPIDGTRAFIMGSPMWGTLIGLLDGGKPVLGLMDQPFTRERFWARRTGAYLR